ncbi:CHAP domain-containing protein [Micromonospora sp. DR5-3]|uniref:RHS repeat-associated core domain-containing protein n=1 Tax=Micromonospora sp. DR5-3 TaxID=2992129 RepID=UPI0022300ED1|nr:RHS repeat-associated core domain-containing protein [Micromonospora sp. DR5-3]MCW3819712.1 CHAP domain-containing protein [Micromonospora sp. DR5-3]
MARKRVPGAEESGALRSAPTVRWPASSADLSRRPGVRVAARDRAAAVRAGVNGVLVRISSDRGGPTPVDIDYSGFRNAYGGDWATRLRLVNQTTGKVIPTRNDPAAGVLRADLVLPPPAAADRAVPRAEQPQSSELFALTAAASGSAGSFKPTSLAPSATWEVGLQSGDFNWSYPITVPPMPGTAPQLSLTYNSGSVDGRTVSTNNQASWVGEGFSLDVGYIERSYQSCKDDGQADSEELCFASDNALVTLPGLVGELVRDDTTGQWRVEDDDGWRVQLLTGASSNGDNDGEHWRLTAPDGTQYYFGLNRLPGWTAGRAETNSTLTVPVFGDDAGEPCHAATFAASWCRQAYRWNLDYVVDTHGDAMSQFYGRETNHYSRGGAVTPYDRSSHLTRLDYGQRADSLFTTPAAGRVTFAVADRCIPGTVCGKDQPQNAPDVPWDQYCDASSCAITTPTFWTDKRLATISTQVYQDGAYRDVSSWQLTHSFPASGDGTSASLWLDSLTRTGHVGGTMTLPPVTFDGVLRENRVVAIDGAPPMNRWRLAAVTSETGGQVQVSYTAKQCTSGALPSPESNGTRCYPVLREWEGKDPTLDYFNKYVVAQMAEVDLVGGNPTEITQYEYVDGTAWHYDDAELTPARYKTYSQYRGYQKLRVRTGDPNAGPQELVEYVFLRGMDDDLLPGGAHRDVWVTDSQGSRIEDKAVRRGFARETTIFDASGGWVERTISEPLEIRKTATRARPSGNLEAYLTAQRSEREFTKLSDGSVRATEVRYTFDEDYGTLHSVDDLGDLSTTADDRCTTTTYTRNVDAWIVDTESRTETVGKSCAGTPSYPADLQADTRYYYDGSTTWGAAPTKGDVTMTEEASERTASSVTYVQAERASFDAHGRPTVQYDALGNRSTMTYAPSVGGPLVRTDGTNALGHTVTSTIDPYTGEPLTATDANGRHTEVRYDPLGRLTGVWLPGRDRSAGQSANVTFSYLVRNNAPTVTSTSSLLASGGYSTKYSLFDGFLRLRQTQAPSPAGGRIVTDEYYDSRGRLAKRNGEYWNDTAGPGTQLLSVADSAVGSSTRNLYDSTGRETAEILLSYGVEQWRTTTTYGGNWVAVDPPAGETPIMNVLDADDKVVELRQYQGDAPTGAYDATRYTYTPDGENVATVTDPAGNVWRSSYDLRGRLVRQEDPDAGTTTYGYDDEDHLVSVTSAAGQTVAYTYDALGRKTSTRQGSPTGPKLAEWTFDTLAAGKGLLSSSTRYANGNAYTRAVTGYDPAGRPTGTSITIPAAEGELAGTYTYRQTYDAAGQPASMELPSAGGLTTETLRYGYEATLGLLTTMTGLTPYLADTMYDELGRVGGLVSGPAGKQLTRAFNYDAATDRLLQAWTYSDNPDNPYVADQRYTYDPSGNILSIVDAPADVTSDAQCFRYDGLRQLTEAWTPESGDCAAAPQVAALGGPAAYWHSFRYDKIGNRLSEVQHAAGGDTSRTYQYPAAGAARPHGLMSVVTGGPGGSRTDTFSYDADGNTTSRMVDGVAQQLTWDVEGELATSVRDGKTTAYLYDADGNRLIERGPDGTTLYLDSTELRLKGSTVTAQRYYTVNGTVVAVRTAAGLTWTVSDHQGTGEIAVDGNTLAVTRRYQTPFGASRGPAATWPSRQGFVGGTVDGGSGLVHLGAREYDPAAGRFISVDPVIDVTDPQQMNAYAYAENNPITFSDPDGLKTKKTTTKKQTTAKKTTTSKKSTTTKTTAKKDKPDPRLVGLKDQKLRKKITEIAEKEFKRAEKIAKKLGKKKGERFTPEEERKYFSKYYKELRKMLGEKTYNKMFGSWFKKADANTAWCAVFVTWVLTKAGVKAKDLPKRDAAWATNWGKNKGKHDDPRPGDIMVYGKPGADGHVEIVTKVHSDGTVTTIGGNRGNRVQKQRVDPKRDTAGAGQKKWGYISPPVYVDGYSGVQGNWPWQ